MKRKRLEELRKNSDLSQYTTTTDFSVEGVPFAGIPIFVRLSTMQIEYLPTAFCVYVSTIRARTRSSKTWKTYGHAMLTFLRFMESRKLSWKLPREQDLAAYRALLEAEKLSVSSVARGLSIVCEFYEWLATTGNVVELPFVRTVVRHRRRGLLAHLSNDQLSSRPNLIPKIPKRRLYPRYFHKDDQERIFAILSERDQLIMEWALYTGARQFEICALTLDQIPSQSVYRSRKAYNLKLAVSKNGGGDELCVPTWLLTKTHRYIRHLGRAEIVDDCARRGMKTPQQIFLSRYGKPLQPNSVYRNFSIALKQLRMPGTFHQLRHTYAISTLDKLMQLPRYQGTSGHNALLDLRDLMRHASIDTTLIYLSARRRYLTEIDSNLFALPERYANAV